jgi:hypothetical protein
MVGLKRIENSCIVDCWFLAYSYHKAMESYKGKVLKSNKKTPLKTQTDGIMPPILLAPP